MPTILLLDASLSMARPVPDAGSEQQRRHLAIHAINTLLDYCSEHCKLEFICLVEFSSHMVVRVPFTRDFEQIKSALEKPDDSLGEKTCIEAALAGIGVMVVEEWGVHSPCQLILITDGSIGVGEGSLKHSLQQYNQRAEVPTPHKFPIPYLFPCKMHTLCIAAPGDADVSAAVPMYEKLISIIEGGGEVFLPDAPLNARSVQAMTTKLAERFYCPFHGSLKCGNLKCNIQLFPPPDAYHEDHEFERVEKSVSRVIEVCGFLDTADVASPAYISRHLVLPMAPESGVHGDNGKEEEEEGGEGKLAAFTVLLHGSLKVENMVALTQLADDWFGIIYSWADSKKKANLMLSVFKPGANVVPWMGSLTQLAPIEAFTAPPYGEDDNKSPFPVRPTERRSYSQNCVVWLKQTGIQADIQKILRNARKLPEKQQHFYKELNRVRRAALAFGFHELLDAVAQLLERECTMLPGNAHPDAALQLTHAANSLKTDRMRDVLQNVMPLRTNFSGE